MFDLEMCVAFITNTTSKKLANAFNERLLPLGITRVQWIALYFLGLQDGISQTELGEKLNIKDSTVVRLIDRMEKDGYVTRLKHHSDRRITIIKLTEKGQQIREAFLPEGEKMLEIFATNISEAELEVFKKVLKKMVENIT